ncbi:MAG TPA: M56 family metallopeptidase, partial [Longimicrobium sp.]|nr:M56 family metallopeptidase [Longimicrobium sp.]
MSQTSIQLADFFGAGIPALLADVALKGVLIVALAALAAVALRHASAAARHLVWTLACAGLLLLPLLAWTLPAWRVPLLPADLFRVEIAAGEPTPAPSIPVAALSTGVTPSPDAATPSPSRSATPTPRPAVTAVAGDERPGIAWTMILPLAWAMGALAVLGSLLIGMARLAFAGRGHRPLTDGRILETAARSGVRRRVTLLVGAEDAMPLTWGVLRPRILLPAGAERWTRERLEAVLLHELAHVRRLDCLWQVMAEAACAVHWFNPLAWAAARRLRLESEHACDDHVLAAGPRATDYADHLLDVARTLRRPRAAS